MVVRVADRGAPATLPADEHDGRIAGPEEGLTMLRSVWSDWRSGVAVVVAIVGVAGLVSALVMPRGPITTGQALSSIAIGLALGVVAGLTLGNRWSLLLAPVVFIVAFELGRFVAVGPTVDGISVASFSGIGALASGRLFHGMLALAPMVLGGMVGIWLAARLGDTTATRIGTGGWVLTAVLGVALAVLAFFVARPATTAPIVGDDGAPLAGSIAELVTVPIGGHDQSIMLRGTSTDNPVVLHLAGGPGGTDLGAVRGDESLEQDFVVAVWDQRGTGKSYPAIDPINELTLEGMVADTITVTDYLRDRFDEDKIYLAGNSWGTLLGVLAVEQRPDLFHAFVGTGQMVSPRETDVMFYEDTLAWAEAEGDDGLVATLEGYGPPPYEDVSRYEKVIGHEHDWNAYPGLDASKEMPFNTFVAENTLMDRVNAVRGLIDTLWALYPQIQDLDLRRDVPALDVPVVMVIGEHEARGRAVPAEEWFEMLDAPTKERVVFAESGHRPQFEEPEVFAALMTRVRDATYPRR